METHRKLTFIGSILLVATFLLHYHYQESGGFNYAYVTGIGMLAAFAASFVIFTKDKLKD